MFPCAQAATRVYEAEYGLVKSAFGPVWLAGVFRNVGRWRWMRLCVRLARGGSFSRRSGTRLP